MQCDICGRVNGHLKGCPESSLEQKSSHYCSICDEGIYDGEEYIMNDSGEYAHCDCFCGTRDLLEWLGYKVRTMEDCYEEF